MRSSYLTRPALMLAMVAFLAPAAEARPCSLGYFKTYIPKFAGLKKCDEQGVPAQFAGDIKGIFQHLTNKGYSPEKHDQRSSGSNNPQALALITQLGNCTAKGENEVVCQLYIAVIENGSNKTLFEKTLGDVENANFPEKLHGAIASVPSCTDL